MSDEPEEQSLRERFAVEVKGWIKNTGEKATVWPWTLPDGRHSLTRDIPPWDTDDGLAIKVAEEWCKEKNQEVDLHYDGQKWHAQLIQYSHDDLMSRRLRAVGHKSLATAICEAMIAAAKETNVNINKCVACTRGSACPHCGKVFCVAHGSEHFEDCKVDHRGRER